nr:extended synaptotagmin-2-like isoform X1 [Cherax quadricarinatus]
MFHLPYTLLYPPHMLFHLPHTSFTHYLTLFIQYFCILVVGWQVWLWCGLWGLVVVAMVIAVSPKKIQNIIWFAHEKHTKKDLELYLASLDKQEFKKLLWNFKMTMPLFSSWVKSADVEKPEWLSKVITHLWPPISVYIEKHLRLVVEPKINDYLKKWKIFTFKFKTMREPSGEPEILGVKVYDTTPSKDVILEVHFTYTGNFRFSASNTKLEFGTTHIQITGSARIILKHLLPHPPFVGHVRIVPITSPDVNIHFRGVANWPIISKNLIDSVKEAISWSYDLSLDEKALSVEEYKSPTPEGVISLRVTGNDEVDSCIIRQGSNIFRGCKPWTSVFEVICYSHVRERGIVLEIEADDHIYSDQLDIEDIIKEKYLTKHYRVADNLHSFFSTEATWFELTNDAVMLTEQWQEGEDQARRTQSCAVLKVWLDYAEIFVFDQKLDIRLKVGGKSKQMSSSLVYSNGQEGIRIEFEEGIDFLIADPQKQKLKIQVSTFLNYRYYNFC